MKTWNVYLELLVKVRKLGNLAKSPTHIWDSHSDWFYTSKSLPRYSVATEIWKSKKFFVLGKSEVDRASDQSLHHSLKSGCDFGVWYCDVILLLHPRFFSVDYLENPFWFQLLEFESLNRQLFCGYDNTIQSNAIVSGSADSTHIAGDIQNIWLFVLPFLLLFLDCRSNERWAWEVGMAEAEAGGVHGLGQCAHICHKEGQLRRSGYFSERRGASR